MMFINMYPHSHTHTHLNECVCLYFSFLVRNQNNSKCLSRTAGLTVIRWSLCARSHTHVPKCVFDFCCYFELWCLFCFFIFLNIPQSSPTVAELNILSRKYLSLFLHLCFGIAANHLSFVNIFHKRQVNEIHIR